MATQLNRFKQWAYKLAKNDDLLVHFYIVGKKEKIINDPPVFFDFNLVSKDKCWQIKGTHGVGASCKGQRSKVPVLNSFKVDHAFYMGLKKYYANQRKYGKFKYAIVLSRKRLGEELKEIVDVLECGSNRMTPKTSWKYDRKIFMKGILDPFNFCNIVRVKIPEHRILKEPIYRITPKSVVGFLVQHGDKRRFNDLLKGKGMSHAKVFVL